MIFRKRRSRPSAEPVCQGAGLSSLEKIPPGTSVAPSKLAEARQLLEDGRAFAPHCDQRILHEPGECWACDMYPDWQALRVKWGIAFTGQRPVPERVGEAGFIVRHMLPCPADYNRPPGSPSDHQQWPNNRAERDHG
jgi:hypothetical protein